MFNKDHELVYSYIDSASSLQVEKAYHVKTKSGNDLIVGDVSFLTDLEEGIIPTKVSKLAEEFANDAAPDIFELKSLHMLPSKKITFFDLLEENRDKTLLEFVRLLNRYHYSKH